VRFFCQNEGRGGKNSWDYRTIDFWNSFGFVGIPWDYLELLGLGIIVEFLEFRRNFETP
jgi:hypothetical protein